MVVLVHFPVQTSVCWLGLVSREAGGTAAAALAAAPLQLVGAKLLFRRRPRRIPGCLCSGYSSYWLENSCYSQEN